MPFPDVIDFLPFAALDSSRLTVLKSQYNRFAARLNAARLRPYGQEEREILVQLKYIKEQIEQYLWPVADIGKPLPFPCGIGSVQEPS